MEQIPILSKVAGQSITIIEIPVETPRRFNVYRPLIEVETTSRVYWNRTSLVLFLPLLQKFSEKLCYRTRGYYAGVKIFERKQVTSLYWFATQIFDLFYPKFTAEFNKLCINV